MTTPTYLTATQPNATPFVAPIFPGYLPAVQGTQAQVSDQVCTHNENLRQWKEHENVTKALRKQMIDSIDPAYIAHLDDPFSGFNKVPIKISYWTYSKTMEKSDPLISWPTTSDSTKTGTHPRPFRPLWLG
jgi:hypothetical protein